MLPFYRRAWCNFSSIAFNARAQYFFDILSSNVQVHEAMVLKKWVMFVEVEYFLGKPPLLYQNDADKGQYVDNELLHLMKPFPMINVGMALRIFQ